MRLSVSAWTQVSIIAFCVGASPISLAETTSLFRRPSLRAPAIDRPVSGSEEGANVRRMEHMLSEILTQLSASNETRKDAALLDTQRLLLELKNMGAQIEMSSSLQPADKEALKSMIQRFYLTNPSYNPALNDEQLSTPGKNGEVLTEAKAGAANGRSSAVHSRTP